MSPRKSCASKYTAGSSSVIQRASGPCSTYVWGWVAPHGRSCCRYSTQPSTLSSPCRSVGSSVSGGGSSRFSCGTTGPPPSRHVAGVVAAAGLFQCSSTWACSGAPMA
ncbi:hypothetical protein [Actinophytocola algeriensis]|uniref:Uncharacterized protein n=1 Tax=Actinophytocola algeriensis TaxID=1768010 RepID=A0A7W7QAF7_9PSEU|nr:hypothetical protein [Actinophytocola algeriensis]MBB4910040.1 hypothetical protein [Actinophytocola algeriensis]MBE1476030.1 hypothetical protein [Actinophytocola algeriensis]